MTQRPRPTRIGVLLSGTGRTLQNLQKEIDATRLDATVVCVIADRDAIAGLTLARDLGLPTDVLPPGPATFERLRRANCDLVCLCGYLRLLLIPPDFEGRVLNIHPSLLPRHGGKGYHGRRVHQAVLAAGDHESGCTVHICNNEYDRGPIVLQHRVPVIEGDTAESLAARVFEAECSAYPQAIRLWQQADHDRRPSACRE